MDAGELSSRHCLERLYRCRWGWTSSVCHPSTTSAVPLMFWRPQMFRFPSNASRVTAMNRPSTHELASLGHPMSSVLAARHFFGVFLSTRRPHGVSFTLPQACNTTSHQASYDSEVLSVQGCAIIRQGRKSLPHYPAACLHLCLFVYTYYLTEKTRPKGNWVVEEDPDQKGSSSTHPPQPPFLF